MVNTVAAANAGNRHGDLAFVRAIRRGNIEMARGILGGLALREDSRFTLATRKER